MRIVRDCPPIEDEISLQCLEVGECFRFPKAQEGVFAVYIKTSSEWFPQGSQTVVVHLGTGRCYRYPGEKSVVQVKATVNVEK